jgi:autotransporter-associated beta strand protein
MFRLFSRWTKTGKRARRNKSIFDRRLRIESLESREMLSADTHYWVGGQPGNYWNNALNWSNGIPDDGDSLVFDSTTSSRNTVNNLSATVNSIDFQASDYSISGTPLSISGSITVDSGVANIFISANVNLAAASGQAVLVDVEGSNDDYMFLDGNVSGTSALTKAGTGALYLRGTNTYSGGTNVDNGKLEAYHTFSLPTNHSVLVMSGATLAVNNYTTVPWTVNNILTLLGNSNVTFNSSSYLGIGAGNPIQFGSSDIIAGNQGLKKLGSGILQLYGQNTYSGETVIVEGQLQLIGGNDRLPPSGAITITGGILALAGSSYYQSTSGLVSIQGGTIQSGKLISTGFAFEGQAGTVANTAILDGTVGLNKTGSGTLTLSGANTYSGGTNITDGTLQLSGGNDRLYNQGSITITGGVLDLGDNGYVQHTSGSVSIRGGTIRNGTIYKSGAAYDGWAGTVSAVLAGGVGLTKTTDGILTLGGINTYTGGTAINGGILSVTSAPNLGNDGLTFNGGTLQLAENRTVAQAAYIYNGGGTIDVIAGKSATYSGVISNATGNTGAITKTGSGTLRLSGTNTYTGATEISGGTLQIETVGRCRAKMYLTCAL